MTRVHRGLACAAAICAALGPVAGIAAGRPAAAAVHSQFYLAGIGIGGEPSLAGDGGNGQIMIDWGHRAPPRHRPVQARRPHPQRLRPSPEGSAQGPALPLAGFPFAQAGVIAVVLIGLGALVTWAGGRPRQR